MAITITLVTLEGASVPFEVDPERVDQLDLAEDPITVPVEGGGVFYAFREHLLGVNVEDAEDEPTPKRRKAAQTAAESVEEVVLPAAPSTLNLPPSSGVMKRTRG